MSAPRRIQRKRSKGWRMPEGAVYVGRPTKWGNPFKVGALRSFGFAEVPRPVSPLDAVRLYRRWLLASHPTVDAALLRRSLPDLAGHDLACWCPLEDGAGNRVPCHADVLLELANPGVDAMTDVRGETVSAP